MEKYTKMIYNFIVYIANFTNYFIVALLLYFML